LILLINIDGEGQGGDRRGISCLERVMITASYVRLMAEYNAEMNRRLYAAAARLSDEERRVDRGAFWKSIHGTLVHLLWGDIQWMSRFDNWPKPEVAIKQSAEMVQDFDTLRSRREKADADIIAWADRRRKCDAQRASSWCTSSTIRRIIAARLMRC
jgi:uncharacterized damage-inducible protein DinB